MPPALHLLIQEKTAGRNIDLVIRDGLVPEDFVEVGLLLGGAGLREEERRANH